MIKTWLGAVLVGAAVLGAAPAAAAQDFPLSLEVRLDGGIPVQDSDDLLDSGVGFGIRAALEIAPTFALYGGYSRFQFDFEDEVLEGEEIEEDGFELGGRVGLDGHGDATPYILLGALFHEDDTGLEAGIGADYPVTWQLSVTPEVKYRTIEGLDYLALGLGARFRF